ncbi:hypothetical protein [Nakamurella endophytica]|uniref:Uncharacterized protein n=1 Tax=Nakamurella endophytica TaxID=1748367 RepID=A0A917T1D8_9ACTN|nr:hypothetical protein [Nakamurella endophytica]GGM07037.1 hypothetical protein GCM10011594_28820 [Nakamurella endophytica]
MTGPDPSSGGTLEGRWQEGVDPVASSLTPSAAAAEDGETDLSPDALLPGEEALIADEPGVDLGDAPAGDRGPGDAGIDPDTADDLDDDGVFVGDEPLTADDAPPPEPELTERVGDEA